jgi:hypothetical protein
MPVRRLRPHLFVQLRHHELQRQALRPAVLLREALQH